MVFTQKALKHFLKIRLVCFSCPFDRKDRIAGIFADCSDMGDLFRLEDLSF